MTAPRTRSQGAVPTTPRGFELFPWEEGEDVGIQFPDFIRTSDRQGLNVLVHGKKDDLTDLRGSIDCQYVRQPVDFNDKLCALNALEISIRPVCGELNLSPPTKGVLLDAFLTNRDYKPAARKFCNFSTGDESLGDPKEDRKREGFLSINSIRIVLYLISRSYSTNFRLGVCRPREDGVNFDVTVFDPLVDETTRKFAKSQTVWLYKNNIARDNGLGWEGIAPDDSRPISLDSTAEGQLETGEVRHQLQKRPATAHKRQYPDEDELLPPKRARAFRGARLTRAHQASWLEQSDSPLTSLEPSEAEEDSIHSLRSRKPRAASPSNDSSSDEDEPSVPSHCDINYIRQSPRAQKHPPWAQMSDISIPELLLWFPNHVLNWPGLALLIESKGWDQAHVAIFLYNNLVATMKKEDQYVVKLNTIGSKLARAIKRLPFHDLFSFTTRANYKAQTDAIRGKYLLEPPTNWETEPAELWEFFIPPEKKEIRIPPEVRDKPFTRRLYNAYCDRRGIARPYDDVPEPQIVQPGNHHPLLDSPELDTEYPAELGFKYIRPNPQEWLAGTTALPLTIDARVPEDYDRRDIVRDFPHVLFGDTFLYVHAELTHKEIVQIWRDEHASYLRYHWKADTETAVVKKAEAAIRKRKQIAIELQAARDEGIDGRRDKATNPTIKRINQAFENYKGECGRTTREVKKRLSRSELDQINRERERRRVNKRSKRNQSRSSPVSSIPLENTARSVGREARTFTGSRNELLASDVLYSGPPAPSQRFTANRAAVTPYLGLNTVQRNSVYYDPIQRNAAHQNGVQRAPWHPNMRFLPTNPPSIPMGMNTGTVPMTMQNGFAPGAFSNGGNLDGTFNFDFNNNLSLGSLPRSLRMSNPQLSAIPNANNTLSPLRASSGMHIDPALLNAGSSFGTGPVEPQVNNASGESNPHMGLFGGANRSAPFPGYVPPFLNNQSLNQIPPSGVPQQDQRRSTGNGSNGWGSFMAQFPDMNTRASLSTSRPPTRSSRGDQGNAMSTDDQSIFNDFTVEIDEDELQKRKSSDRSLSGLNWNAFVAMPGAGPMELDADDNEEMIE